MNLPEVELPEWGVFAQFGHNEHVGKIDKVSLCGKPVVRVRKYRPKVDGQPDEPFDTVLLGADSMYGVRQLDEAACRAYHPHPLDPNRQLPPARSFEEARRSTDDDFEEDDADDEHFEPVEPRSEDTDDAHDLLDRIGHKDSDDVIPDGEIDTRVNELIRRYGFARETLSFIDDAIERFWTLEGSGLPTPIDEDRSAAVRILGEDNPKLERVERTFAMLRALIRAAEVGTAPPPTPR